MKNLRITSKINFAVSLFLAIRYLIPNSINSHILLFSMAGVGILSSFFGNLFSVLCTDEDEKFADFSPKKLVVVFKCISIIFLIVTIFLFIKVLPIKVNGSVFCILIFFWTGVITKFSADIFEFIGFVYNNYSFNWELKFKLKIKKQNMVS